MAKELAIETRGLTKRFERHLAVNDLDLQIPMGEVYGLIGPNGAGKTTLLRMLATIEEPTKGEIYINGEFVSQDHTNAKIKQRLGYLPDDFPLYDDLTVWDYLDYFARLYYLREPRRNQRIYEVLEIVQLTQKRNRLISTLSRGMKQRLSLGRTIIHEEIIKNLHEAGMTIVISSHVLSDLEDFCSYIGIMELGYLVESSSIQDLYKRLSVQHLLISTLGKMEILIGELKHHPGVESWEILPGKQQVKVQFSGTEKDAAILLRSLISAEVPLSEFNRVQENLESIFLKLGHKQAS